MPAIARPRLAHRLGDPRHALGERAVRLVGETVIILDEIETAARQFPGQFSKGARTGSLRLERRAGQRPCAGAHARAQAGKPVARTAKSRQQRIGKDRVLEHHIGMDRRVAEQHVEKLSGLQPGGGDRKADADLEHAIAKFRDVFHPAQDIVQHRAVGNRGDRHLHALLNGDGLGPRGDAARGVGHMIDCGDAGNGRLV
jgi:hypothetical protein